MHLPQAMERSVPRGAGRGRMGHAASVMARTHDRTDVLVCEAPRSRWVLPASARGDVAQPESTAFASQGSGVRVPSSPPPPETTNSYTLRVSMRRALWRRRQPADSRRVPSSREIAVSQPRTRSGGCGVETPCIGDLRGPAQATAAGWPEDFGRTIGQGSPRSVILHPHPRCSTLGLALTCSAPRAIARPGGRAKLR